MTILPFDAGSAVVFGERKAALEKKGTPRSEPDLRIAAIALQHNLTLIPGNIRHFAGIPRLRIENGLESRLTLLPRPGLIGARSIFMSEKRPEGKIKVLKDGPYLVTGGVPLAEALIITGADGEPERWEKGRAYPAVPSYALCRCGGSKNPPFCDGAHLKNGFDGTETAGHEPYLAEVEKTEGPRVDLTWSSKYCALARFCHRGGDAWTLAEESHVPENRALAVQESCDCPSGALVAWDKTTGGPIEPGLAPAIGLIENRETGQSGPLWVQGGIPIESGDGRTYEIRNRVTLCRCGASQKKPFCDGSHIACAFKTGR